MVVATPMTTGCEDGFNVLVVTAGFLLSSVFAYCAWDAAASAKHASSNVDWEVRRLRESINSLNATVQRMDTSVSNLSQSVSALTASVAAQEARKRAKCKSYLAE